VAIIALARKLICLIHHLLVNQELFDMGFEISRRSQQKKNDRDQELSSEDLLQDRVAAIVDAYYRINAKSTSEGGG